MLEHCGCTPAKCNKTPKGKMCPKHGIDDCSMKEERDPKGPVKPYKSPEEIAKKHKVSSDTIAKQVKMGTKVEGEHTTSKSGARITALQHVDEKPDYYTRLKKVEQVKEGNLHQWFKGSRSKDGKPGWVNVVTGGTCASDESGEGTPKCVSSSKRTSMTKSERLSASRRKKSADPGQQLKSGAAKPTYVSTDVKEGWSDKYKRSIDCDNPKGFSQRAHCQGKKKMQEGTDAKSKGSGKKDACYNKVKARYDVWPSAYASGALVKCRQKGAKNWGNKSEEFFPEDHKEIASGKKKDEEGYMSRVEFDQIERSINILRSKIKKSDQQIPAWVQSKITRAADFIDTAADYMSSEEEVSEACWVGYKQVGMKKKVKRMVPNCVKENIDKIQQYGRTYTIILTWHGSTYKLQIFFSTPTIPSRKEVESAINKVYPGALLNAYMPSRIDPTKPMVLAREENEIEEAVLGRYKEDRGGVKTLRSSSERTKPKKSTSKLESPKITILKTRGPRKGEATASQVQGWRGTDRTNTNRKGQSTPQAKSVKENFVDESLAIVFDPDKEKRRKNYLLNIGVIGETEVTKKPTIEEVAAWQRKAGKHQAAD